jgi:hypothetical protein
MESMLIWQSRHAFGLGERARWLTEAISELASRLDAQSPQVMVVVPAVKQRREQARCPGHWPATYR